MAGAANWGRLAGATTGAAPRAGTDDIESGRVPWAGGEGLTRGLKNELWPPLVFATAED